MTAFIWNNGAIIPDGPVFSAHTRMRIGECVFNTMLAVDGRIIHADKHLEKILRTSKIFFGEWKRPAIQELEQAGLELLRKNEYAAGRYAVNVIITRGSAAIGLSVGENAEIQIVMRALPAPDEFPPVHAVISQTVRRNEGSPLSRVKCAHYGDNILAMQEARQKGANEVILLNNAGKVVCAASSNLFIIQGGTLYTPPLSDGAQEGITRGLVMRAYGAIEKSLSPDDLMKTEGIYVTNAVRGVVPVKTLDRTEIPAPSLKIDKDFHLK